MTKTIFIIPLFLIFYPSSVYAYIGPGMSGGAIAAIIGFFAAILIGLWGILYYPLKRALKNRRGKKISSNESEH